MLKYIELKSGYNDNGPAWIANVQASRSGRTVYFNGMALKQSERGMYRDIESGDLYWISGIKKGGTDRHWAGSGKVLIEASAVPEYLALVGAEKLDERKLATTTSILPTDISRFVALENTPL